MNVQEFINSTLRLIGVIASGESPSTAESNDALSALNQLLSGWSAAGLPVYQLTRQTVPLTGVQSYTLGFRPVRIRSAAVSLTNGINQGLEPYTAEQWASIRDKSLAGLIATVYLYDAAFPSPTIRLWPIPATGGTLEMFCLMPLTAFAALSDTVTLPPGYEHALRFALASVLAPEYGATLTPEVQANIAESKNGIAAMNQSLLGGAAPAAAPVPAAPVPVG